jgi:hypothetical protein
MTDEPAAEGEILAETVRDLGKRFPDVPDSVIAEHVHQAHARLTGAPVRDYVPVLVERQARLADLATVAAPDATISGDPGALGSAPRFSPGTSATGR